MANYLRPLYLLRPDIVFLNHGSFGATPIPVFEEYQQWQRRLESQPVEFLISQLPDLLETARQKLGDYVNADKDDLVHIPNATFGVNVVANSLELRPGDEVLTTDHEYGACDNIWRYLSGKRGFKYVQQPISIPLSTAGEIAEQFWQGVTEHTKAIFISHITSSTACLFPVVEICARARKAGILTIVDGAHALGQIDLDLGEIGADFYLANEHKWLSAPKGSAFIHTRREKQHLIEPLVVGWGWGENRTFTYGSDYLDNLQWLGTNDLSAYLAVPAAIDFQAQHEWTAVRQRCHALVRQAMHRVCDLTGLASIYPGEGEFYQQMAVAPLPAIADLQGFKAKLYDKYRVEIPCTEWNGCQSIRISVQGYNSQEDIDALLIALEKLLPQFAVTEKQ
jgi:isopenicillin-N epimerase